MWKQGDRDRRKMPSESSQILTKLNDIEVQVATLTSKFESSHKAFRDFEAEIKEINHRIYTTIYGNGQPGLTTKINGIETLSKDFKAHSANDKWFQGILVTIFLTILGWTVFKH